MCSTWCPRFLDAAWCLRSDVMTNPSMYDSSIDMVHGQWSRKLGNQPLIVDRVEVPPATVARALYLMASAGASRKVKRSGLGIAGATLLALNEGGAVLMVENLTGTTIRLSVNCKGENIVASRGTMSTEDVRQLRHHFAPFFSFISRPPPPPPPTPTLLQTAAYIRTSMICIPFNVVLY